MYSVPEVLDNIDHNAWVWIFTAFGWACGFTQLVTGIWLTWRNRIIALPLGYIVIIFAHDSSVALNADYWFNGVGHWYFIMSWAGSPLCVIAEAICIVWFSRLWYREFQPAIPERLFSASMALFVFGAIVLYRLYEQFIDDPLHVSGLFIAQIVNITFMIPLILRRGSAHGTNRVLAWALVGVSTLGMCIPLSIVAEYRTFWGYATVASMASLSLFYVYLVHYFQRRDALAEVTRQASVPVA